MSPVHRHLLADAGLFLVGTRLGFSLGAWTALWPWLLGGGAWLLTLAWGWGRCSRWMVGALMVAGGLIGAMRTEARLRETLSLYGGMGRERRRPEAVVTVEGSVSVRPRRRGGEVVTFFAHLGDVPVKVVMPRMAEAALPEEGSLWRVTGALSRREPLAGRFGRRVFFAQEGRRVRADTGTTADRAFARLSAVCAEKAAYGLFWCPTLAALNRAILLGRRLDLPREYREIFVAAGTVHVFAISGLHVMLIAYLLVTALAWAGVPVRFRGILSLPALGIYVMMTGARPSAVRAAVMAGVCLSAGFWGRRADALSAWAVTALVVYARHPERLFDAGCTLSFVVMLGIVLWLTEIYAFLPEKGRQAPWNALGVSFAAWVAGAPMAAHVFGRLTPGGLLANLVVLPLVALTVSFGFLGMLLGFVFPPLAAVFNTLAALTTALMVAASGIVSTFPGASFAVPPWSSGTCLLAYGLCAGGLFLLSRKLKTGKGKW